ncbi:MAG: DUF3108 domain-containing protein [Methylophilaceae bacterium]
MIHKLIITKLCLISILLIPQVAASKQFPNTFFIEYEIKQLDQEGGSIRVEFNHKENLYSLIAKSETVGILKLFGDRQISSDGFFSKQGFKPVYFEHKNKKNPNKNIQTNFLYDIKKIDVTYKGEIKRYSLGKNYQDLATFMFQFNFEKKNQKNYRFNVVEGKKMRPYQYQLIKETTLPIADKLIDSEIFEGMVNEDEKTKHYVWISKSPYRIPVKIKVTTKLGLMLDLEIKETNLF